MPDLALASRLASFLWSSIPDDELLDLARQAVAWVAETPMRVLVPADAELAFAAGAAGVHLSSRADERTVAQIRAFFPGAFVSVSCHTLDEVERARSDGADAVLFAPVFGKAVDGLEVVQGVGLAVLRQACQAAGAMPVFALGGVNALNAAGCIQAGAAGIAGIRMFWPDRTGAQR